MNYNPFYNIENPQLMSYEYAWVSFMKQGVIISAIVPQEIKESWRRCRKNDIHFTRKPQQSPDALNKETVTAASDSKMLDFIRRNGGKLISDTFKNMEAESVFYGVITDKNGCKLYGVNNYNDETEKLNIIERIEDFSEENVGTNCFSIV